jgi:hypothetical protein
VALKGFRAKKIALAGVLEEQITKSNILDFCNPIDYVMKA